jgi:hypothetical protein
MDFLGSLSRIFTIYKKFQTIPVSQEGFGYKAIKYRTKSSNAFLFVFMSPPAGGVKGKAKDLDKIIEKSSKSNKLILPKEFSVIRNYLASIFPEIRAGRDEILMTLKTLMAGIRLEFVPFENMRYSFLELENPQIMVYDSNEDGIYSMYVSFVDLKEDGLLFAFEKQIQYICEQIDQDIAPTIIENLPPLRTGNTGFNTQNPEPIVAPVMEEPTSKLERRKALHERIKKKKEAEEKQKEMQQETVISQHSQPEPATQPNSNGNGQKIKRGMFGEPIGVVKKASPEDQIGNLMLEIANLKEAMAEKDNLIMELQRKITNLGG